MGIFLITCCPVLAFGQCEPNEGLAPAFEFNIPAGVTITSVKVKIEDYIHKGPRWGLTIRSFQDLDFLHVYEDGEFEVLLNPITGPSVQDIQILSGLDDLCGLEGDMASFTWRVTIVGVGLSGTALNYSGPLGDNLAIPDNLGSIYDGVNIVSGTLNKTVTGATVLVFEDKDLDGYGDQYVSGILGCTEWCLFMYSTNNLDCDDLDPEIHPDQTEIIYNGRDDDCNSFTPDDDLDEDGFAKVNDCDDTNSNINPGKTEIPYNGVDDDCNPVTLDNDLDQDGFVKATDCDDSNSNINPGKTEIPYNGIDDDCNPVTLDDDLDQDGFIKATDCDDTNPGINPDKKEILKNGIDEDCDGADLTICPNPSIAIYPNPTDNDIKIELPCSTQFTIELFDMSGKKILSVSNIPTISLKEFANGVYLIKVIGEYEGLIIKKIIKLSSLP